MLSRLELNAQWQITRNMIKVITMRYDSQQLHNVHTAQMDFLCNAKV